MDLNPVLKAQPGDCHFRHVDGSLNNCPVRDLHLLAIDGRQSEPKRNPFIKADYGRAGIDNPLQFFRWQVYALAVECDVDYGPRNPKLAAHLTRNSHKRGGLKSFIGVPD